MIMSTWSIIMMIESPYNNLHRISETRYISSALKITWAIYQRSDNKTIKPLFWHINWLNLWCTGPTRYRWMSVRVRGCTLFFIGLKCQYFNLSACSLFWFHFTSYVLYLFGNDWRCQYLFSVCYTMHWVYSIVQTIYTFIYYICIFSVCSA